MKKYMAVMNKQSVAIGSISEIVFGILTTPDQYAAFGNTIKFHEVTGENEYGTFAEPKPSYKATIKGIMRGQLPVAV